MLNRYKAAPKTGAGKIGYAVLCGLSLLILAAMVVVPVVMFLYVYGDPWWELIFFVYLLMIPLYVELLALLASAHYGVRRTTGTVPPSRWETATHILYAVLGTQCLWIFPYLADVEAVEVLGNYLYIFSGMAIVVLWIVDRTRAAVCKYREAKQKRQADMADEGSSL